jgi:hypothetical protein
LSKPVDDSDEHLIKHFVPVSANLLPPGNGDQGTEAGKINFLIPIISLLLRQTKRK